MAKQYKISIVTDVKGTDKVAALNSEIEETIALEGQAADNASAMGAQAEASSAQAVAGFGLVKKATVSLGAGFKLLKAALISTGIGAIAVLVGTLVNLIIKASQGSREFRKVSMAVGDALEWVGDILDIVIDAVSDFLGYMNDIQEGVVGWLAGIFGMGEAYNQFTEDVRAYNEELERRIELEDIALEKAEKLAITEAQTAYAIIENANKIADAKRRVNDAEDYDGRINQLGAVLALTEKGIQMERDLIVAKRLKLNADAQIADSEEELAEIAAENIALMGEELLLDEKLKQSKYDYGQAVNDVYEDIREDRKVDLESFEKTIDKKKEKLLELRDYTAEVAADIVPLFSDANEDMIALIGTMDELGLTWLGDLTSGVVAYNEMLDGTTKGTVQAIGAVTSASLDAISGFLRMIEADIDTTTKAGFEKSKKMRLAGVVLDTISGVLKSWVSALSLPAPASYILGGVMSAATNAMGLVAYNKVKSTNFDSSGSPGGGGGGGTSIPQGPVLNLINPAEQGESRLQQEVNNDINTPVKAYVTSSDMSSQQALDRRIEDNATF